MKLSENFTLSEMLVSGAAHRFKIYEQFTPSEAVKLNLKALCENVLQPLRDEVKRPIYVSSGYRCPKVNKAIGGARTSQHIKGEAADIQIAGITTDEICRIVLELGIEFDQMIEEYGSWVHISFKRTGTNRNQVLQKKSGQGYRPYNPIKE